MFSHARRGSAGSGQGPGAAPQDSGTIQARPGRIGLPVALKAGMERESGLSLDRVRVRYNSSLPARFDAAAAARGASIDIAPGQERYLPHELGHVVQQMRGRVPPTAQLHGAPLNDDPALEAEADRLGARALRNGGALGAAGPGPATVGPLPGQPGPPSAAAPLQLGGKQLGGKRKAPPDAEISGQFPRAVKRKVDYASQLKSSGFSLSRDETLIYPRNPIELIGSAAAALWGGRKRKGMTGAHSLSILKNAFKGRATGAIAYTKQESDALGTDSAPDLKAIAGTLDLAGSNSSRNHRLADSAVYSILANMLSGATSGWGTGQDDAVADLVRALHGNGDAIPEVQRRMNEAAAAITDRDRGAALSEATFLASHGADNLRLGDAKINGRVLNAFDPNFTKSEEFVGDDDKALSADDKDALLKAWKAATPAADRRLRPAFRRRGTIRSEKIRAAVLKLARDGLIESQLAEASVTGVYDRETGEPLSSSFAMN